MTKPNPDMYSHTVAYTSNMRQRVNPMCEAMSAASWLGLYVARTPEFRLTPASVKQADGIAVDRNGVALRIGQLVKVHQEEGTRTGIVVETFPLNKTCTATGCWVDVNIEGRGPEGIPSYILEVEQASPAAGESSPISPEVPQAHGTATLAIEALNVIEQWAASGQLDADSLEEAVHVLSDIESKASELLNGLTTPATPSATDDCVETIQTRTGQEWIVRLSKDLLTISDEYGEILHRSRGHITTGVYLAMLIENDRNRQATPSAAVGADGTVAGDTVPPEVGKRYVCRNGEVTEAMWAGLRIQTYPFRASVNGVTRTWMRDGKHDESKSREYDLISEYHEPEPSLPVELHPVDRLRRELDAAVEYHSNYTTRIDKALGQPRSDDGDLLTEHLREIERLKALSEAASSPAESPDDWVMLTDPKHVIRTCDQVRPKDKSVSTVWADCEAVCGDKISRWDHCEFQCRRRDLPPVPVESKTRTVTLREYRHTDGTAWSSSNWLIECRLTGRTCECEVPE